MAAILPIILAGTHLLLAADRVPQFDITPSCRAAAAAGATLNRTEANCEREENQARDKLQKEWGQFSDQGQQHCSRLSQLGGLPSYVELLTCLEMTKAAKNLPTDQPAGALRIQ